MSIYTFRIIIEPDEKNTFHGYVPSLRGCHTWGKTIQETRKNLRDAIKCHIQGLLKDKNAISQDKESLEFIQTFTEKELIKN
ncbi:type II toxin-antitoxin system HicB family antitoxin [Candidatus Parcubacteria bacterium]|nr:type II toxin-antitoxin system HicB family antitoxin [Candidatus Parcubacteria bacterium]